MTGYPGTSTRYINPEAKREVPMLDLMVELYNDYVSEGDRDRADLVRLAIQQWLESDRRKISIH